MLSYREVHMFKLQKGSLSFMIKTDTRLDIFFCSCCVLCPCLFQRQIFDCKQRQSLHHKCAVAVTGLTSFVPDTEYSLKQKKNISVLNLFRQELDTAIKHKVKLLFTNL